MKKTIISAILLSGLALAGQEGKMMTIKQLNTLKKQIPMFTSNNINIARGKDMGNYYALDTTAQSPQGKIHVPAFILKDTQTIFVGSAYTKNGKKIKPPEAPKDAKIINSGVAFSTQGTDKDAKTIYLLTDPECPFCKRLEEKMGDKFKQYNVKTVLFPLSFHKHSKPMVQWILRGKSDKERADRMTKIIQGDKTWMKDLGFTEASYNKDYAEYLKDFGTNNEKSKFFKKGELKAYKQYLEKSNKAFAEAGAKGTPTVLDNKFHIIKNPYGL